MQKDQEGRCDCDCGGAPDEDIRYETVNDMNMMLYTIWTAQGGGGSFQP